MIYLLNALCCWMKVLDTNYLKISLPTVLEKYEILEIKLNSLHKKQVHTTKHISIPGHVRTMEPNEK